MSDTKWTMGDWIPRGGMICWHSADSSANGQTIEDAAGKAQLDSGFGSTPPVYQTNVINGLPALYFDGSTNDPPKWTGGSVTPKHVFVVAGFDGVNFGASYRGLVGGATSGEILVGNPSSNYWFNFAVGQTYRRYDVAFPESGSPGIFGQIGLMEISNPLGWAFSGIQIGQQRNLTDRRWKGWWCEQIFYDRVLSDVERWKIYRYIACKYRIWQQEGQSSSKAVYPFPADRPYGREHGRETYLSEPYDGDPTALVRGNFKSGYELAFTLRRQEELDAAKAFYEAHHPLGEFIFRDYRFNPYRDSNVRFTSNLRERGSDVTYRFNYSFDVVEA